MQKGTKEVLLEPIVEYQPELGGTKQSAGKIRSLALSLMLRESAGLMNGMFIFMTKYVCMINYLFVCINMVKMLRL